MNLTPWCNLFSAASKYSITVNKSRYKIIVYVGVALVCILILLTFFTYAYHLALTIAVAGVVLLGLLLAKQNSSQVMISTFELNDQGQCSFEDDNHYQLHLSSRYSFLGCWLVLQPISTAGALFQAKKTTKSNSATKLFFIYRDSLSKQDFSRISKVITQLYRQP